SQRSAKMGIRSCMGRFPLPASAAGISGRRRPAALIRPSALATLRAMRTRLAPVIAVLLLPATAMAELRIDDARFHEGDLFVRGATSGPLQTVTLDGRFTTTSDHEGRFNFQLR